MRDRHPWLWLALPLPLLAAAGAGCSLVSDLDRFKLTDAGTGSGMATDAAVADASADAGKPIGCDNPATLCLRLKSFNGHADQLLVVDLVTETHELRARAVLDPAIDDAAIQEVVLPLAVPPNEVPIGAEDHPLHVEVWADVDGDRKYDKGKDLGWIVGLDANSHADLTREDDENTELQEPADIGGDFEMKLSGFSIHATNGGKLFEVMVIDAASGRAVGLYRLVHVPASGSFDVLIPGIIETETAGTSYDIEFYADADSAKGNQRYDGFPEDHSWIMTRAADGNGLQIERTHSRPSSGPMMDDPSFVFKQLTYQFRFEN